MPTSTSLAITQFQNEPVSRFSISAQASKVRSFSCAAALRLRSFHCRNPKATATITAMATTIIRLRLRTASRAATWRAYSSTLSIIGGPARGTATGKGAPHFEQVVELGRFWCPHFAQETIVLSFC